LKTLFISLACCVALAQNAWSQAQTPSTNSTNNTVIEGGKLVVELIKAIGVKKDQDNAGGCKDAYADLCIENQSSGTITVSLLHRDSKEVREVVVMMAGKECCLQAKTGVWTYDLKILGSPLSLRKGDLKLEGCNNMVMSIK
jgi:hypothetical protein